MTPGAIGLACAACVCLALAGCGGNSGRESRAEFVAKGNAACKHANDRLVGLTPPRTFKALVPTAAQELAIGNELHASLRSLRPPAESQKRFDRYLRDLRAGLDKFSELKAAAQRRDVAGARTVLNEIAANPSGQEALDLGLTECARSVSPQR
jgi:hypothetical protein